MQFKKYDICIADFDPKKGRKQAGVRPCIILQSNAFNKFFLTSLVVPLTSNISKCYPSDFLIHPSKPNGLEETSRYLGSQMTVIDNIFILEKIGVLEERYFDDIKLSIKMICDLDDKFFTP